MKAREERAQAMPGTMDSKTRAANQARVEEILKGASGKETLEENISGEGVVQGEFSAKMAALLSIAEPFFPMWAREMIDNLRASGFMVNFVEDTSVIATEQRGDIINIRFHEKDLTNAVTGYNADPVRNASYLSFIVHELTHANDIAGNTQFGKKEFTGRKMTGSMANMLLAELNAWKNEAISGLDIAFINEPKARFNPGDYDNEVLFGFCALTPTNTDSYIYKRLKSYFNRTKAHYEVADDPDQWLQKFLTDNWPFVNGLKTEVVEYVDFIRRQLH